MRGGAGFACDKSYIAEELSHTQCQLTVGSQNKSEIRSQGESKIRSCDNWAELVEQLVTLPPCYILKLLVKTDS